MPFQMRVYLEKNHRSYGLSGSPGNFFPKGSFSNWQLIPRCLVCQQRCAPQNIWSRPGPLDHMFECWAHGHFVLEKSAGQNPQIEILPAEKYFLIRVCARAKVKGVRSLVLFNHSALLTELQATTVRVFGGWPWGTKNLKMSQSKKEIQNLSYEW